MCNKFDITSIHVFEAYEPFKEPVLFKRDDGSTYEEVRNNNHWRDGVREIGNSEFVEILGEAGLNPSP